MATIKAMVAEKIRQEGYPTEEEIRKVVAQYLKGICLTLPGENNRDRNPIGVEFADIMFQVEGVRNTEKVEGRDLHEKAVNKLIKKIMDERDDLCDKKYEHLRLKIVEVIATTKSPCDLYDGISYKNLTKATDER